MPDDGRLNIGQFLARRALINPDRTALVAGSLRLTFRQLNGRANRLANAAAAYGLRRGDRVAALLRNSVEYYELYFGLAKIGVALCGINWRLASPEVAYIVQASGARLLFYSDEFAAVVDGMQRPPLLERQIHIGVPAESDGAYAQFLAHAPDTEPESAGGGDDALLVMFTSGTTGLPKGVMLTHEQMFWASATVVFTMDCRDRDVMLVPMPMYHIGGMCFVTVLVHRGATSVLLAMWDPGEALALVARERVNHFMAVPTMLTGLLNHPDFAAADLSSLRWLLASAAPVPVELIRALGARGITVLQSYGLTETAGPATVLDGALALEKAGSAGMPYFHTQVKLVDEDGQEAAPGEAGEILIRGPHVISGYWQNPAATAAAFVDGWFRSGDIGRRDADGYLYIVDRKKDMIISGGENIYPAEIENVLFGHPKIAEVAVIGIADDKWGEAVCAVLVPRDDDDPPTLAELHIFCAGKLARFKLPRQIILRQALPRNPTGKLLKSHLREQLQLERL